MVVGPLGYFGRTFGQDIRTQNVANPRQYQSGTEIMQEQKGRANTHNGVFNPYPVRWRFGTFGRLSAAMLDFDWTFVGQVWLAGLLLDRLADGVQ